MSADRDFYQASQAILQFHMIDFEKENGGGKPPADLSDAQQDQMEDFENNAKQVEDGIQYVEDAAVQYADLFSGTLSENGYTLEQLIAQFNESYSVWKSSYSLGDRSGSIDEQMAAFESARNAIDEMESVVENYKNDQFEQLDQSVNTRIMITQIVIVLVLILVIIQAIFLARSMVGVATDIHGKLIALSENNLAGAPLSLDSGDEFGQMADEMQPTAYRSSFGLLLVF